MSSADATPEEFPLPLDAARQVDRLCDRFEARWRDGNAPDVDGCVAEAPPEARAVLREELSALVHELGASTCAEGAHSAMPSIGGTPRPAPAVGSLFGEYELLELLGEGGMGTVYRAWHRRLGQIVALKLVRTERGLGPTARARFEREMRAVGRLDHPNIVEAKYAGEQDGTLYLVMKHLEGVDLGRLVRQSGPLRVADACEIGRQVAVALQHIHEQGLVHRDIKPSNVMLAVSDGGTSVKVLDLGLARLTAEGGDGGLTGCGMMGTPDYAAPEQADDPSGATIAADLYALGCTLFCLLTGRPPFAEARGLAGKFQAHQGRTPPDLSATRPGVPAALADLVNRLLAKDPQQRPQTPAEVVGELGSMTAGADLPALLSGTTPPPAGACTSPENRPGVRPRQRRRVAVSVLVGIGVAAVVGSLGLFLVLRQRGEEALPGPTPPAQERLTCQLVVRHYAVQGQTQTPRGPLGERSFAVRYEDQVQIGVQFSEPVYAYLLSLNANGIVQPCFPEKGEKPSRSDRLDYPPDAGDAFGLKDERRGGVQAFVVVASRRPLPEYTEWSGQGPALTWRRVPVSLEAQVVWRGNGRRVEELLPGGELRGEVTELAGVRAAVEFARRVAGRDGVDAVEWLAFPVVPR